jgi:hypothetical protein
MAHTWKFETGGAMGMAAKRTFERVFTEVQTLQTADQFTDAPLVLLITPSIRKFHVSQGLTASLQLHCTLVDKMGQTVYENTVPAKGGSQAMTGCLLGVWGGQSALAKTSEEAFNTAFSTLADDIVKKVDFSPYIK